MTININPMTDGESNLVLATDSNNNVTGIVNPNGGVIPVQRANNPELALSRYRAIPNSTARKIAWVGDSTTMNLFVVTYGGYTSIVSTGATTSYQEMIFGYSGSPFYNVTHGQFWVNGGTMASFSTSTTSGKNASDVAIFNPDLIIFSYGINDVRLGTTSQTQLETLLDTSVRLLQSACPNADIILRIPTTLNNDAATLATYVSPATKVAAQTYSNTMRNAYRNKIGKYNGVYVQDFMRGDSQLVTETVQDTKGVYYNDCLHLISEGNGCIVRDTALLLGNYGSTRQPTINAIGAGSTVVNWIPLVPNYSSFISNDATTTNVNDYLISPRVLEDKSKYNLLFDGWYIGGSAGSYMDIDHNNSIITGTYYTGIFLTNDIVQQLFTTDTTAGSQGESIENGVVAWKLTSGAPVTLGSQMRWLSIPAGYPHAQNGNNIRFYRPRPAAQKKDYDPQFSATLTATNFTATTLNYTVPQFGVAGVLTATSATANTTGGTLTVQHNGTTIATMTFSNGSATSTGTGTFFTDGTRGRIFNEGDLISVVINAGFVGGTLPLIKFSA